MSKGLITCLLLLSTVWGGSAAAREIVIATDGCTELTRMIYTEVSAAVTRGPAEAGPWMIDEGRGEILKCEHVAVTVSRAFTAAMASAGIEVTWQHAGQAGRYQAREHCPRRFLSLCRPTRLPAADLAAQTGFSLVHSTWELVSRAVMREMYNPMSSDVVNFRRNDLKLRLGLSLRSIGAGNTR